MKDHYVNVPGQFVVDAGVAGKLDTLNDQVVFDVRGIDRVTIYVDQITQAGTCTLLVEATIDGVDWATIATLNQGGFPTGNNKSIRTTDSDAHGMPIPSMQVRVTLTAVSGGGVYSAHVAGFQKSGYSG